VERFLSDDSRRALREAAQAVEAGSSAEIVVSIRGTSASYLAVDLAVAIAAAVATLAFALWSPYGFSLEAIFLDPLVAGGLAGAASWQFPAVRRALVPRAVRRRRVLTAARAAFVERGVHHTSGRTGVLVYLALSERLVVLVADGGVARAVPEAELAELEASLGRALVEGRSGVAVAAALRGLAAPLARYLPRAADDVNELADEVD
jgi:putative membrane protein